MSTILINSVLYYSMAYKLKLKSMEKTLKNNPKNTERENLWSMEPLLLPRIFVKRVNFVSLPVRRNVSNFRRISMKKDTATLN